MSITHTPPNHETSLVCDESAPASARAVIRKLDPAAPRIGDAMLLASELVTNAVRHSGCRQSDRIMLRTEYVGAHLRIEVCDPARSSCSPHLAATEDHFGAMGLRVVEALADRWGAQRGREQVVWAEIGR
jgi:anti-sigma regulatory factor (Ser/Thr protein kinase)